MRVKKLIVMTVGALLPLAVADAEESAPGPLEEIVVSEFRPAPVRELDSSITVLNEAAIESASLQHFEELIALVPNMNFSGEGSRARYFQLRGIGELEQYEGAPNPSVGFILDDIDLSGVGGISTVFDLQHVEVLRGPQATRFGANALAGLVYLQSVEPTQEVEGVAQLQAGSKGIFGAGFALGGGLSDSLSGRFSLHRHQVDGFYDNVSLGVDDSNERQELTARGKLRWD
ncbi:MAG: TonB-dependent receptor plug domain-containing protein, partial [Xanthomonadales bacterium]|nr:TonB-dependent receptor plug domain-containing protein [Xanthomonadales bacterium]